MSKSKDGIAVVITGLFEASEKASYSLALGAGALGLALWGLGALGVQGHPLTLMASSAFFLFAKFGRYLDLFEKQKQLVEKEKQLIERYQQFQRLSAEDIGRKQELYQWMGSKPIEEILKDICTEEDFRRRTEIVQHFLQRLEKRKPQKNRLQPYQRK